MKKIRASVAAGISIGVLACSFACGAMIYAVAQKTLPLNPALESSYCVGDVIELEDIGIETDGKILQASPVIYSPKGDVDVSYDYTVEYPGTHRIDYVATANGKRYVKSYSFDSLLPSFSTKSGSLAEYGVHTKNYLAGYLGGWGVPFDKVSTETYEVKKQGIYLDLAANDVFTYNKVLDLNNLRDTPFITFTMLPEEGERDVEFIDVTLTDVYDPTIAVSVQISTGKTIANNLDKPNSWTDSSYIMAKTGVQTYCGLSVGVPVHGINGMIFGSRALFAMYGNRSGRNLQTDEFLSLTYDCEEMQLFQDSIDGEKLVCDFDNSQHFDTLFKGFTSNEAILSVSMRNCYTSGMKMVITSIGNEDLSQKYVEDFPAPGLTVNTETAPETAIVGYGFPVPAATANCPYTGAIVPEVRAYFAYGSASQYDLPVTDGYFYPEREGRYTLVYTAKSVSGEVAQKRVDIAARNADYKKLSVAAMESQEKFVGEKIALIAPEVTGGVGSVNVSATVRQGEEKIEIIKNVFVPKRAGDYVVEWTATDVLGREAKRSYTVFVSCSEKPIINEDDIRFPAYFIKGYTYAIPQVSASLYTEDGKTESSVTVTATNGIASNGKFTASEAGIATFTFTATDNGQTDIVVREVPVLDVSDGNGIALEKYFDLQNLTSEKTENYIEFTSGDLAGAGEMRFINKFVADGFYVTAFIPSAVDEGACVDIFLTDIYGDGKIILSLVKTSAGMALFFGGEQQFVYAPSANITLVYRRSENRIYATDSVSFPLDGFEGFRSGYCYFSAKMHGENVSLRILSLAGQNFTTIGYDAVSPNVAAEYDYEFNGTYGAKVTVYRALSADVLDPYTTTTVTVRNPNGEIVTAVDGTRLDGVPADRTYEIVTDSYGYFNIRYEATCSNGQMSRESYSIYIVDSVSPELKVTGSVPATLKVGASWRVAAAEAIDNVSDSDRITVLCVITHLSTHDIGVYRSGDTYLFEKVGQYVVRFVATDESGNATVKEYAVTVME